jgi:hypothetical protein
VVYQINIAIFERMLESVDSPPKDYQT